MKRLTVLLSMVGLSLMLFASPSVHSIAPVCGDTIISGPEDCEDGNVLDGDCCSADCKYEALDSPCDDGNDCTDDACGDVDFAGVCLSTDNDANTCDDDDACTEDDACTAGECAGTDIPDCGGTTGGTTTGGTTGGTGGDEEDGGCSLIR